MKGTVFVMYGVPIALAERAIEALAAAAFVVHIDRSWPTEPGEQIVEVAQHYGDDNPDGDVQRVHGEVSAEVLRDAGIPARHVSHGVVADTATPTRPTWEVLYDGAAPTRPMFFWADLENDAEVESHLDRIAAIYPGVDRSKLAARSIGPTPEEELLPGPAPDE